MLALQPEAGEPAAGLACNSFIRKLLVIAAAALVLTPTADAKVCASVSIRPLHPRIGNRVQVRLTTWMPQWVGRRANFAHYVGLPGRDPLRVRMTSPRSNAFDVRLRRDFARPWLWRGWLTFGERGRWTLSPDSRRWAYAPLSCASSLRVDVT